VAILQTDPRVHFPDAPRVVEILTRALTGPRSAAAVVIDNNPVRNNEMAGHLNQIGFEVSPTFSGREGFQATVGQSNVVLVAIHANVIRWPLSQTVSNLRADARSASLPIVIYGPDWVRKDLRGVLTRNPHIAFVVESATPQNVEAQIGPFLKMARAAAEPPADRVTRVAEATAWLAYIAGGNRTDIFRLFPAENALMVVSTNPSLAANALLALAAIPSAAVQQHFEQLATSERLDASLRTMAARHLAAHIQRHGLLLPPDGVRRLEASWTQASDRQLATALAAAVGTLKPNARLVTERLQNAAPPTVQP
jgi:hypothetical protein